MVFGYIFSPQDSTFHHFLKFSGDMSSWIDVNGERLTHSLGVDYWKKGNKSFLALQVHESKVRNLEITLWPRKIFPAMACLKTQVCFCV